MIIANKYNSLTQKQINRKFIDACEKGKLELVKYLLTSSELTIHAEIGARDGLGFKRACEFGKLDTVKYLLTSTDLKEHSNIKDELAFSWACAGGHLDTVKYLLTSPDLGEYAPIQNFYAFAYACAEGHLEVVKYLLTSPDLVEHVNIRPDERNLKSHSGLYYACKHNQLEVVKYLLTSPDLKVHADINYLEDGPLKIATARGHVDIVKYLLTSPEIIAAGHTHPNIYDYHACGLRNACHHGHLPLLEYLIFDYGISMTEDIKSYLTTDKDKKIDNNLVLSMFEARESYYKLHSNLQQKKSTANKNKL